MGVLTTVPVEAQKGKLGSGINVSNLDKTANPANDFYQYSCGGWMKAHPLSPEYSRYGSFDKLAEDNEKQVKTLIEALAKQKNTPNSIADKIATVYNMGMDSTKLQKQGAEPIKPMLKQVSNIADNKQLQNEIIALHKEGIMPFFGLFSEADYDNSKMTIAWLYQGGLGLGERDYYLENDAKTQEIRTKYRELISNMFKLAGYDKMAKASANELADMVLAIETRLATASFSKEDQRDPYKNFHKASVTSLAELATGFNFPAYFSALGLDKMKTLNVAQPSFIIEASNMIKYENIEATKAYLAWNIINSAASFLSDDFVQENFNFYGKVLSGKEELRPRWKRVSGTVNGTLGEAIGQMYVEKYFPAQAKERMITLVKNLQIIFAERIQNSTWMEQETKKKAIEKLNAMYIKIGYPDKWRDYSGLEIKNDSYYDNVRRSNLFDMAYMVSKIDKPTDIQQWGMTPQTVNAYYNPTTNEICFPAAILQPPFFDMKADDAANYGAIGVVIGHEMTHGFDDQGCQYDKDGNLKNWWAEADAENFKKRTQILVDCFNKIEVAPGTFANGSYTLGENIADNGGLQISYQAMQKAIKDKTVSSAKMDGFTPEQRFFLAYAAVWAGNIREQEILRLTKIDPHSLGKWRVNATLPHIQAFIDAFDIKAGDKMFLPHNQQALIW